jgi:hypothetical protein
VIPGVSVSMAWVAAEAPLVRQGPAFVRLLFNRKT